MINLYFEKSSLNEYEFYSNIEYLRQNLEDEQQQGKQNCMNSDIFAKFAIRNACKITKTKTKRKRRKNKRGKEETKTQLECLFKRIVFARENTKYIKFLMTYNWILWSQ